MLNTSITIYQSISKTLQVDRMTLNGLAVVDPPSANHFSSLLYRFFHCWLVYYIACVDIDCRPNWLCFPCLDHIQHMQCCNIVCNYNWEPVHYQNIWSITWNVYEDYFLLNLWSVSAIDRPTRWFYMMVMTSPGEASKLAPGFEIHFYESLSRSSQVSSRF